ncbi:MAG: hypothetical protein ACT4OP_11420 [Actinomycetota bacterium]
MSLVSVLIVNSPWLPPAPQLFGHGVANALGQETKWSMFSAGFRDEWFVLRAQIEQEGGQVTLWRLDPNDRPLSYRHLKWLEDAALRGEGFAELGGYLIQSFEDVTRLRLWLERHQIQPPGGPARLSVSELVFEYKANGN